MRELVVGTLFEAPTTAIRKAQESNGMLNFEKTAPDPVTYPHT
ncbi:hypothetical protein HMPREF3226_00697 [Prevotella corporis]|uniref:Uncharacterized protein n=1 Tax=Prevotella corporis TaxID=28128 RepID=A0A133QHI5_9BACT|nr:hypothetical protein HMPREF3226_00697 [Prevotella corporis]